MPITYRLGNEIVRLEDKQDGPKLAGLSNKRFLVDPAVSGEDPKSNLYILKSVRGRSVKTVLGKNHLTVFMAEAIKALGIENYQKSQQALMTYADYLFDTLLPSIKPETVYQLQTNLKKHLREQNIEDGPINKVLSSFDRLVEHTSATLCDFMQTEKLGPLVAKALWGDAIVVPETYYPVEFNYNEPQILSRVLKEEPATEQFCEFLGPILNKMCLNRISTLGEEPFLDFFRKNADKKYFTFSSTDNDASNLAPTADDSMVRAYYQKMQQRPDLCRMEIESPSVWLELKKADPSMKLPKLAELGLTPAQKQITGKLYAMALITGHYDIFNNINAVNSGSMSGKPACVDWGNNFMIGFGGLTKDEIAFNAEMGSESNKNLFQLIVSSQDDEALLQEWASMEYGIGSNEFAFPYIELVFPYFPRQLVQDIFNLDDPDIFSGFAEFVQLAAQNKSKLKDAMIEAWPADNPKLAATLNKTWYHPDNFEHTDSVGRIVGKRVEQLANIIPSLQQGQRQADFHKALMSDIKEAYKPAFAAKLK